VSSVKYERDFYIPDDVIFHSHRHENLKSYIPNNTDHIWDVQRVQNLFHFARTTAALGINNRAKETMGITIKLNTTSQTANFIKQVPSFLAYGGSSTERTK
jgi:hypothetical protein